MASAEFEHVHKTFPDGTRAVRDFSLDVQDGELVVLVGPSGCGKSTVLRMLAGLEEVTEGTIRIGDRVVNDLSPQQRNVAMVFQDYALYPYLSVRRNLEFPLRMRKLPRKERRERAERVAALLEINTLLERLPRQLSGGQRQRVAMGRALVREPTVFLLDEPLSNLDARLRTQVRAEIAELQRRTRATMLYVTHDQVEAMTLGQRVAVLHEGWLQQVATPRELYERPANVFVASFIGSPPMNQFPTRVSRDGRGQTLMTVGEQSVTLPEASGIAALGERNGSFTAGIRPEALRLSSEESRGSFLAVVESVEFLGHESLIYSRVEATAPSRTVKLTARIEGAHDLSRGEKVRFEADARQIHFFDENGRRVGR